MRNFIRNFVLLGTNPKRANSKRMDKIENFEQNNVFFPTKGITTCLIIYNTLLTMSKYLQRNIQVPLSYF